MSYLHVVLQRKRENEEIFELVIFTESDDVFKDVHVSIDPLPHIFQAIGKDNPVFRTNIITKQYPASFDVFALGCAGGIEKNIIDVTLFYTLGLEYVTIHNKIDVSMVSNSLSIGSSQTAQLVTAIKELKPLLYNINQTMNNKVYDISSAISLAGNSSYALYSSLSKIIGDKFSLVTGHNNARMFIKVNGQHTCIFHASADHRQANLTYSGTFCVTLSKTEVEYPATEAADILKHIKEELLEPSETKHIGDREMAVAFINSCISVCNDFPNGTFVFNFV